MKSLNLVIVMMAAALTSLAAQAKSFQFSCALPEGQQIAQNFSGTGQLVVQENGDSTVSMDLNINGPATFLNVSDFAINGKTQTFSPGSYMVHESYGFAGTSVKGNQATVLRVFLAGPENQATSQLISSGVEYRSLCKIVQ